MPGVPKGRSVIGAPPTWPSGVDGAGAGGADLAGQPVGHHVVAGGRVVDAVARDTGAQVLVLAPSVGGVKEASDYIALFDYNLARLVGAITQAPR